MRVGCRWGYLGVVIGVVIKVGLLGCCYLGGVIRVLLFGWGY